MDKKMRSKLD